jgi:hypothetical protein
VKYDQAQPSMTDTRLRIPIKVSVRLITGVGPDFDTTAT